MFRGDGAILAQAPLKVVDYHPQFLPAHPPRFLRGGSANVARPGYPGLAPPLVTKHVVNVFAHELNNLPCRHSQLETKSMGFASTALRCLQGVCATFHVTRRILAAFVKKCVRVHANL